MPAHADVPAAPRDTYAEATRPDQIVLTWKSGSDPAPPLELYAVYRDGVKLGEIAEPRFEDEWLLAGKTYEYVVRAIGPDGESADSAARAHHDAALARVRDRPLSAAAHRDRRGRRLADIRARHDRARVRAGGRTAAGRRSATRR